MLALKPKGRLGMSLESGIVRNYTIFLECCFLIDKFAANKKHK